MANQPLLITHWRSGGPPRPPAHGRRLRTTKHVLTVDLKVSKPGRRRHWRLTSYMRAALYAAPPQMTALSVRPAPAPLPPRSLLARLPADALLWKGRRRSENTPSAGSLALSVEEGSSSAARAANGEGSSGSGEGGRAPLVAGAAGPAGGRL